MYGALGEERAAWRHNEMLLERKNEVLLMLLEKVRDQRRWVDLNNFKQRLDEAILFPTSEAAAALPWQVEEEWRPTAFWRRALYEEERERERRVELRNQAIRAMALGPRAAALVGVDEDPADAAPAGGEDDAASAAAAAASRRVRPAARALAPEVDAWSPDTPLAPRARTLRLQALGSEVEAAEHRVNEELVKLREVTARMKKLIDKVWAIEGSSLNLLPQQLIAECKAFTSSAAGSRVVAAFRALPAAKRTKPAGANAASEEEARIDLAAREFAAVLAKDEEALALVKASVALTQLTTRGVLPLLLRPEADESLTQPERAGDVLCFLLGMGDYRDGLSDTLTPRTPDLFQALTDPEHRTKVSVGRHVKHQYIKYLEAKAVLSWLQDDLERTQATNAAQGALSTISKGVDQLAAQGLEEAGRVLSSSVLFAEQFGIPVYDSSRVERAMQIVKDLRDKAINEKRVLQAHEVYEAILSDLKL
jgi:hypothetical protein